MGRALLITCLGSFVILAMVQQGVRQRQFVMTGSNVQIFEIRHARNAVNSGLELGINRVIRDQNWDNITQPWMYELDGVPVNVWVDDNDDFPDEVPARYVRVRSEHEVANRSLQAYAYLFSESIIPTVEGAVGFYGTESDLKLGGNASINGYDTNPDLSPGPDEALPGIVSVDEEEELVSIDGNRDLDEFSQGNPNFLHNEELDAETLNEMIAIYKQQGVIYDGGDNLGSPEHPQVTIVDEGTKIASNFHGAGILVVTAESVLELRGTVTFEGLVIVEGTLDIAGTVSIFGAVMFSDNSLLEIDPSDADFTGNESIHYSSVALNHINNRLSHQFNMGYSVDRINY